MDVFFGIFILLASIFSFAIGIRAIYYAFIKKKDERSKWIVVKSMAESFIVIIILQLILAVIKWLNYDFYQLWWKNFKEGIYIEPVLFSFIVLGIILIINTKKHGGSL